jgi:hypothetical protein
MSVLRRRLQANAKAAAVRGNAARLVRAPTLAYARQGLAARMLLVRRGRLVGIGADDRIHSISSV